MTQRKTYQKGSVKEHYGSWTLRIRELDHASGKWKTRRYVLGKFKGSKAALNAADPIIREVNERNNSEPQKLYANITFKAFVESYWQAYTESARLQPSTLDAYGSFMKNHLLPSFGEKKMREVTPSDIGKFLQRKRRKLSAGTVQIFYVLLRLMFDLAEQYDLIGKSPVRPKLHRPTVEKKEKPTLNAEQIRAVLNEFSDPQERLFVLLISVSGLRLGEILALRWCDFESDACELSITHTLYRGRLKKPKTVASEATLKLHPSIAGLLQVHRGQSAFSKTLDFIFCSVDGSPLNEAILRKHLYQAMDRVKIARTDRQFGFHIFRHSAGTLLYEKSRDLKLVQGTLRHADISTTSDIYVHLSDRVLNEGTITLAEEILQDCDRIVTESSEMVS